MKLIRKGAILTASPLLWLLCLLFPLKGETRDCPEIEDLTGDTSAVGNPVEPRPWKGGAPGFLEFDEDNYYVYRKTIHGRQVRVAFSKDITEVDEYTRENFARYFFDVWNYWPLRLVELFQTFRDKNFFYKAKAMACGSSPSMVVDRGLVLSIPISLTSFNHKEGST